MISVTIAVFKLLLKHMKDKHGGNIRNKHGREKPHGFPQITF